VGELFILEPIFGENYHEYIFYIVYPLLHTMYVSHTYAFSRLRKKKQTNSPLLELEYGQISNQIKNPLKYKKTLTQNENPLEYTRIPSDNGKILEYRIIPSHHIPKKSEKNVELSTTKSSKRKRLFSENNNNNKKKTLTNRNRKRERSDETPVNIFKKRKFNTV
jgi:alpha-mannosidase